VSPVTVRVTWRTGSTRPHSFMAAPPQPRQNTRQSHLPKSLAGSFSFVGVEAPEGASVNDVRMLTQQIRDKLPPSRPAIVTVASRSGGKASVVVAINSAARSHGASAVELVKVALSGRGGGSPDLLHMPPTEYGSTRNTSAAVVCRTCASGLSERVVRPAWPFRSLPCWREHAGRHGPGWPDSALAQTWMTIRGALGRPRLNDPHRHKATGSRCWTCSLLTGCPANASRLPTPNTPLTS
jgi:hypothetical protein